MKTDGFIPKLLNVANPKFRFDRFQKWRENTSLSLIMLKL